MPSKPIQYQGKLYPPKTELCQEFGIDYNLFVQREMRGWSIEDAIKTGVGELWANRTPVEFRGILYPSVKSVADEYGLSYSRLSHFYYRNNDIDQAVQRCVESQGVSIELWGRSYYGVSDVAMKFGLKYAALVWRMRDGTGLEQAVKTMLEEEPVIFRGKQYENFVDLCAEYHIQPGNVYERLRYGLTLEDALTRGIKNTGNRRTIYYEGKEYPSHRDLCRAYGLSELCVREQTRRNPLQYLDAFQLLVDLKEQAGIPREEYLNYIPGCRVRGKNYKTAARFAAEFGITASTLYTYKSRHDCSTVFEAFEQMQEEVRCAYLKEGKPEFYSDLLKKYDDYQIKKMNLEKVAVPRYPTIQGFDFHTDCYDTLAIYEGLLNQRIMEITGGTQTPQMEGLK